METKINAQSIINEVMAAHAIAPDDGTEYITFKTSERGTHRIINDKAHLQRFADAVRKNAAAFGGGLIKEEKQKPAVSYPSKSISLYKQLIEDKDWYAALQLAEEKLAPMFAIDRGTAYMYVAPIPIETEPRIVSVLGDCGEWTVAEPVSMRFNSWHKSRQKAEDAFIEAFNKRTQEQKDTFFAARERARIDQSAARAQWMAEHGIVDDEAISARIEQQAAQDVAEVVAQAVAVSAIAEAMEPTATEEEKELVTCEAGESEAQESSMGSASSSTPAAYNTVTAMLASFTPTVPPSGGNAGASSTVAISKEYRYAMVNRPFSIGTAPKDGFIRMDAMPEDNEPHYKMARHGIAVYGRKLTDQETLDYELAPIADDAILENLCAAVTHEMAEYANEYAAMASDDWVDFEWHVINAKERVTTSFCVSIESNRAFADMVLAALKTATLEPCPPVAISSETPAARPVESTPEPVAPVVGTEYDDTPCVGPFDIPACISVYDHEGHLVYSEDKDAPKVIDRIARLSPQEPCPPVAISSETPAARPVESTPEPVSPVVGTSTEWAPAIGEKYIGAVECAVAMANMRGDGMEYRVGQNAIMERRIKPIALQTTKTDDTAKFNIRAKSGAWFACVYMIGTVYGLRFEAKGMEPITGEFATHKQRMQALEMMANALKTPPDGGMPIKQIEAHTSPVAECTPDTQPAVSRVKPEHDLKVGDVVRSSWGYDQTNVNHYQITKLIGKRTVEVRELVEHKESTGDMTGHVAPVWGEFIGEPMRRTVDRHGHVNILREKFGRASKIEPVAVVHGVRCYASTGYSSYA